jgi:hypothetical protein
VQDIGVGELGGQGGSSDVACQRRQGASRAHWQRDLRWRDRRRSRRRPPRRRRGASEQSVAGADHLAKRSSLDSEVGIEGARASGRPPA